MIPQNNKSNAVNPLFQIITIGITSCIIVMFVMNILYRFCSNDPRPPLLSLTPDRISAFEGKPTRVKVGFSVNDFIEFNTVDNTFRIFGVVWFQFDPKYISLETIGKFSFLKGEIEEKNGPFTYLVGTNVVARYTIRVSFKTDLYYGYFPFEDHRIYLGLINQAVTPGEVIFDASLESFIVSPKELVSGWRYLNKNVLTGYGTISLGQQAQQDIYFPEVLFEMDYFHYSTRYIVIILLPLIIVLLIDLFSLCLNSKEQQQTLIELSTTNITGLFAYRFVIESIVPKVGYPTVADYLFFLFLGIATFMFFVNIIGPYLNAWHKRLISVAIQLVVIGVFTYLFEFWVVCL